MSFAPSSTDGGVINIGNSVGIGNANFDGQSSASGPSTNLGFNLNLGAPAQPTLMLVNLDSYNPSLENLSFSKNYRETKDAIYVDGVTSNGIYNQGFSSSKKPIIVTNFTFGDKVYNFTVPAGE
jgi:hypothetical protein